MKKQSTLVFALVICCSAALCQTPAITMTSSMAIGSDVYFTIEATNPQIQVDFGDGTMISRTIGTSPIQGNPGNWTDLYYPANTVIGKLAGSKTVKVYGTGITTFICYGLLQFYGFILDSITSLDVSNCNTLKWLDCSYNQLATLDVSKNTALRYLVCSNNKLSNLNVILHTGLEWLDCSANKLTTLDVSKNTALSTLKCSANQLTTLDITKNTSLFYLNCNANKLTSLDISKNIAIDNLNCNGNQLTALDVSKNTALAYLECNTNQLTSLDVSKTTTALGWLDCSSNQLTNLDVSHNTNLWKLICNTNQITKLDLDNNTFLLNLYCGGNPLTSLNLSNNTQLTILDCSGIKSIPFSLDVSHNSSLSMLYCNDNQFTSLDVSKNTKLIEFYCSNNKLTSLDLASNTTLWWMECYNNQLASLDISHNTGLFFLYCWNNRLTSLDVSKNTQLGIILCHNNQFTFATLPLISAMYAPQSPIYIEKALGTGQVVDLSSQLTVNGNTTVYTWKTKSGVTLVPSTDYSLTDGKTVFLKSQADSVYCEMTNATFPLFTGDDVLKTTFAKVSINTGIDNADAPGVQVYARNKTLYIVTPSNGQASVYDINGRLAMAKEITTGTNTIALPKSGVYLVKLSGSNTPVVKKVFAGN
jgi:Leucine-rich repeat (LRR) protein